MTRLGPTGSARPPFELAGLYATLAGDGVYRPLRLEAADPADSAAGA